MHDNGAAGPRGCGGWTRSSNPTPRSCMPARCHRVRRSQPNHPLGAAGMGLDGESSSSRFAHIDWQVGMGPLLKSMPSSEAISLAVELHHIGVDIAEYRRHDTMSERSHRAASPGTPHAVRRSTTLPAGLPLPSQPDLWPPTGPRRSRLRMVERWATRHHLAQPPRPCSSASQPVPQRNRGASTMTSGYADPTCALDDHPQPRHSRLHRDQCIEHTVYTNDGVCLAVRDYQPPSAVQHTVVLPHGLCLTYISWHNQIRRLQRQPGVRIIAYDHRGHGHSTTAPLRTYTIEQLAGDLADVPPDLAVTGPVTVAGHSMGGMCALAYLARANQPVAPTGLVLIATAAGGLSDHGLGRLLSTPGLDTLADIVDHAPRHAAEQALRALAKPVCAALARHGGYDIANRTTLAAAVTDALHTTPWTTAIGFLRALRNYDHYATPVTNHRDHHRDQWRRRHLPPAAHARELAHTIPNAHHIHRPKGGHMLLHEAARTVTDAINRTTHAALPAATGA